MTKPTIIVNGVNETQRLMLFVSPSMAQNVFDIYAYAFKINVMYQYPEVNHHKLY